MWGLRDGVDSGEWVGGEKGKSGLMCGKWLFPAANPLFPPVPYKSYSPQKHSARESRTRRNRRNRRNLRVNKQQKQAAALYTYQA